MKQEVNIGIRNIYPDFDGFSLKNLQSFLGEFGITAYFLFDDGIEFEYEDKKVKFKNNPNNGGFYDISGNLIFSVVDSFGELLFINVDGKELYKIPLMEEMI